jgi:hypothetical protein
MPATYEYIKNWRAKKLLEDPDYRKREHKRYRETHREQLILKGKRDRIKYATTRKSYSKEYIKGVRYQVLSHYSGSVQPFCKHCGFSNIKALQLDHINNNGADDKRKFGNNIRLARYLIDANFPEGYQVLCANCNTIKEMDRR